MTYNQFQTLTLREYGMTSIATPDINNAEIFFIVWLFFYIISIISCFPGSLWLSKMRWMKGWITLYLFQSQLSFRGTPYKATVNEDIPVGTTIFSALEVELGSLM